MRDANNEKKKKKKKRHMTEGIELRKSRKSQNTSRKGNVKILENINKQVEIF